MKIRTSRFAFLVSCLLLAGSTQVAQAQLGSGWVQYNPTKKIHLDDEAGLQTFSWTSYKSVGSGSICADYRYDSATDTETFRIVDNRSNRSEIRLQNEYMTGRRQFQGFVLFNAPLDDESLFQIFGNTGDGATLTMMRGFSDNGTGKIRVTGRADIAFNVYGVEQRINVIHDQDNFVQYYVNGSKKVEFTESDPANNYHKYGCYGTLRTGTATVKWRAARSFRDGQPPGTPVPDFAISATPSSRTVIVGNSTTYTVNLSATNGFSGSVALSAAGLPAGATASFSPASVTGSGSSTLTVTTSGSTPVTTSTLTLTGTSGSLTHNTTVTLVTQPVPDFSISASPDSQTVTAGNGTTYTVSISAINGFSGSTAFSASGLPGGATVSFNPASVSGSGSSTLTVTTAGSTPAGTNTLTITGTSGSLVHSTDVTLIVNPAPAGLFFEAEGLSFTTNGAATVLQNDVAASGGQWISFNADGTGDYIEYTLPSIPAGTYRLEFLYKRHPNRGTHSLTVDGVKLDGDLDQYSATPGYTQKDFGVITFAAAGTHKVRLTVTGKNASSTIYTVSADAFRLTAASPVWASQNIGAVGLAGSFSQNGGTFTVAGSGSDIWTAADQFRFAYQTVSGNNLTVTARVMSEQQTHAYAKAGVMIRASLATNSVHASVLLTPTNGVSLHIRPSTGATSINVSGWVKGPVPPHWVRLVRSGNTFTGFASPDGVTWTQVGSTNVTMSAGVVTGLAVSSHDNTKVNTAAFDSVSLP